MNEYEEEELVYKAEGTLHVNLELSTDKLEVEHEHSVSLFTLLIICFAIGSLFTSYDSEIRCALGNMKECAKMAVVEPVKSNQEVK